MNFLKTKHERKSAVITTILSVVIVLLLLLFGFTYLDPPPEEGIAVNFGTTEVGMGETQPTEEIKTAPQQETSPETPSQQVDQTEEVVSQETEDAPVIEKKEEKKKTETKEPVKEKPKEETKPDPKPDKSTSDALNSILNGPKNDGKADGGEGNDNQAGDKGNPDGDPNAKSYYGQGKGLDGDGNYRLGGRKALNKEKFVQDCNESGVVVVKIEVNQQGRVISATPGAKGTTNTTSCLTEPAKRAALATRFNSDANAPVKQTGYIVYEFKLSD